jgi:hypothetical protein
MGEIRAYTKAMDDRYCHQSRNDGLNLAFLLGLEYDQVRLGEDATDSNINIWDIYNERASLVDDDLVLDFNSSMDVLLVFVSMLLLPIRTSLRLSRGGSILCSSHCIHHRDLQSSWT